jgi:hypothetical protein
MEELVQRLVQNPHDQEAITYAHQSGQADPRAYALLLEKVGTATSDPAIASHWLTEAANVWSSTLGDAHRAARALMIAIDRDPTQPTSAERLAALYREKGDSKALVALLERRAKALGQLAYQDPEMRTLVASIYEELGRLWSDVPLSQPSKAIENYRRAIEYDPTNVYSAYAARELHKALGEWAEAIPYFAMEHALVDDPERRLALYQDEADVCRQAGDLAGVTQALRGARSIEGGIDPTLKQQLGAAILDQARAGHPLASSELLEGTALFLELAEQYPGEHGYSYSVCALELDPGSDRGIQLAMFYAAQLGFAGDVAPRAAAYLRVNPSGPMAAEAAAAAGSAQPSAPVGAGAYGPADAGQAGLGAFGQAPMVVSDEDRLRTMLDNAEALARKARKNEAAKLYREVLDLDPGNSEAISFMEAHLRQTRKFNELRDVLVAAANLEQVDEEARRNYLRELAGLCETQLRDLDSAIQAWQTLFNLDPTDEAPRGQLRRLLEKAQRWDDLCRLLEQEAQDESDVEVRISVEKSLAKIHEQKRKDLVATGEAWARIAALAPTDDSALSTAVRFLEKGGRLDLAAQAIGENLESVQDPHQRAQLCRKLGEIKESAGDMLAAGEAFSEGAVLAHDPKLWEAAEKSFVQAQAWDQAANAIEARAQLGDNTKTQAQLYAAEAEYLGRAGDESSAVLKLEQATELDPLNDQYAAALEKQYTEAGRMEDLTAFLLKRAKHLPAKDRRVELRRRAATLQREQIGDLDAARESLLAVLSDGDDIEALELLVEDAEGRQAWSEAIEYLARLGRTLKDPAKKIQALLREGRAAADGLEDLPGAIERYERLLEEYDPKNEEALTALAELHERRDNPAGQAAVLERLLAIAREPLMRLDLAQKLAVLYEEPLDDPHKAVRVLKIVRELDKEDFDAIARLCSLAERLEDWARVAEYMALLIEVEGDDREVGHMTRRLAEILQEKLGRGDEALAVLVEVADGGDEECRVEYVKLGDKLGWKGIVASKLVEWNIDAPPSPERNQALRGAFQRFLAVERFADAAQVGMEVARSRGADARIAAQLEEIAVRLKNLDALSAAHELLAQETSGSLRAEETVRQAEVLVRTGVDVTEALQHGEEAMTSVPPAEVETLLLRLVALATSSAQVIDIYERQVTRCKSPMDKLHALGRAAQVACDQGDTERARGFFDLALAVGTQDEVLAGLEDVARAWDQTHGENKLRLTLCHALASGGQGARDGGRTRATLLRRAAHLMYRELGEVDHAFAWLGDALVAHVDDTGLDALEELAVEVGDPKRAEKVLDRALEEVFDGPLVRKLLGRRATLRAERLSDKAGAAADLKRLHELSPADSGVMEQLSVLYTELGDYRGMVQLYEDQILRGKDQSLRSELARQVARIWEEHLRDAREAADAWRRVLRMKSGDPEATAGLERAKNNMLRKPSEAGRSNTGAESGESAEASEISQEDEEEATGSSSIRSLTNDEDSQDEDHRSTPIMDLESAAAAELSEEEPGLGGTRPSSPGPDTSTAAMTLSMLAGRIPAKSGGTNAGATPSAPSPNRSTPTGGRRPPPPPPPPSSTGLSSPPSDSEVPNVPPPPLALVGAAAASRPAPRPPKPPSPPKKPRQDSEDLTVNDDELMEDE